MILRPLVGDPEMTVVQNRWHLRSAMGLGKDESIEQTLADLTAFSSLLINGDTRTPPLATQ